MRLYLDACCLSRPDDDQSQQRIRAETGAILAILEACERGDHDWIASSALLAEAQRNRDPEKQASALARLGGATELLMLTEAVERRALALGALGLRGVDAYHLAFAEEGRCDALLTTDDRFERRAGALVPPSSATVYNPVRWLERYG